MIIPWPLGLLIYALILIIASLIVVALECRR